MSDVLDSIVVEYTGDEVSGDEGKFTTDDEQNRIEQGITDETVTPSWVVGYDFHILCQLPTGYVIDKITSTYSQVVNNGKVIKDHTEERKFFPTTEKATLEFRSVSSSPTSVFYGDRQTSFTVTDYTEIEAVTPPVIADITYPYEAYSLTIKAIDEVDYPVGIVITAVTE